MPKYDGLALCGGGAKGAFQIGAWKALEELGCLSGIKAVSGTSAGALNAVLFALGDFKMANDIWQSVKVEDFIKLRLKSRRKDDNGLLTREGLVEILKGVPLHRLKTCMPTFVNKQNERTKEVIAVKLNDLSESEIIETLLASSSIPCVYGKVEKGDEKFVDGGVTNEGNTPIKPLYEHGCKSIIICSNDNNFNLNRISTGFYISDSPINPLKCVDINNKYKGADFKTILPLRPLGNTFDFRSRIIFQRILQGYQDTNDIFEI